MKDRILNMLAELVACDTQNPPREITTSHPVFDVIRKRLGDGFACEFQDYEKGRVSLLAVRGNPRRLFNVHLDTVPAGSGWTRPPLQLAIADGRAWGRGVCDIKGAAACLIAAATSHGEDVAILFTTDEEGTGSCCVEKFCEGSLATRFQNVIVAEPTGCQAVTGHRGYLSVTGQFQGTGGHTSRHQLLNESANHRAAGWMASALEKVKHFEQGQASGESACFNIGRIDGGIKNNMIARECCVTWSARLPAGQDNQTLLQLLTGEPDDFVRWSVTFDGAPLPLRQDMRAETTQWCHDLKIETGNDVDFWTEAALFSSYGLPATVIGPGDIAQAHTADEWVALDQLEQCANVYQRLMKSGT